MALQSGNPELEAELAELLTRIRACTHCSAHLPHGPRPIIQASSRARVLIVGQAPGSSGHRSGIPWSDRSGDRLRGWLGIESERFYDGELVATLGMGFCYPGTGKGGDPPRRECAPLWHEQVLALLPNIELTLMVGLFAQKAWLGPAARSTLTETVRHWRDYLPGSVPLPHPSPRNLAWFKHNPWFETDLLPWLKPRIRDLDQA